MKAIIKFLNEARTELLKVTWPTRAVALSLTLTVLAVSIAFTIYISGVDYLVTQGIKWVTLKAEQHSSQQPATNGITASTPDGTPVNVQATPQTVPVK